MCAKSKRVRDGHKSNLASPEPSMNMKQNLMHPNDMPIMQGHIKLSSTWCTLGNGCVTFNSLMHHRNYLILETSHMSLSGKTAPKTNLTLLPEFDLCAGKPRDGASWLLEVYHWATKRLAPRDSTKSHTWNLCHKPNTYNWTKLHYNSTACTFCTSTATRNLPRTFLDVWEFQVYRGVRG